MYVNVTFLQRVGVETVTGRGGIGGDRNHITVEVAVTSYDRIFQSGPVISQASIGECAQDFTACDGDFQTKSVELVQPSLRSAIDLANEIKANTIDQILARDDAELALDVLLGKLKR